jgi:hypothetical protein
LLGLLLITAGLYLGFDSALAFVFLIVGGICCAFGLALFVLQLMEPPEKSAATRLSPEFISAGSTAMMPAVSNVDSQQGAE